MEAKKSRPLRRKYDKPWLTNSKPDGKLPVRPKTPYLRPLLKPDVRRGRRTVKPKPDKNADDRAHGDASHGEETETQYPQTPVDPAQGDKPNEKEENPKECAPNYFIAREEKLKEEAYQQKVTKVKQNIRSLNPVDPLCREWQKNYEMHKKKIETAQPIINTYAAGRRGKPMKLEHIPGRINIPKPAGIERPDSRNAYTNHLCKEFKARFAEARVRQRINASEALNKQNEMNRKKLDCIYKAKVTVDNKLTQHVKKLVEAKERVRKQQLQAIQRENFKIKDRLLNMKPAIKTFEQIDAYKETQKKAYRISKYPHFWKDRRPMSATEGLYTSADFRDTNPKVYFDFNAGDKYLGRVIIQLHSKHMRLVVENFRSLCTGDRGIGYKGSTVMRIVPGCCYEFGNVSGSWSGKLGNVSAFGDLLKQQSLEVPHDRAGIVTMRQYQNQTVGSVFMITDRAVPSFNGMHQAIGYVERGMYVLREMRKYWKNGKWDVEVYCSDSGQLYGVSPSIWIELNYHNAVIPWKCPSHLSVISDKDLPVWDSDKSSTDEETSYSDYSVHPLIPTSSQEELDWDSDEREMRYARYREMSDTPPATTAYESRESDDSSRIWTPVTPPPSRPKTHACCSDSAMERYVAPRRPRTVYTFFAADRCRFLFSESNENGNVSGGELTRPETPKTPLSRRAKTYPSSSSLPLVRVNTPKPRPKTVFTFYAIGGKLFSVAKDLTTDVATDVATDEEPEKVDCSDGNDRRNLITSPYSRPGTFSYSQTIPLDSTVRSRRAHTIFHLFSSDEEEYGRNIVTASTVWSESGSDGDCYEADLED